VALQYSWNWNAMDRGPKRDLLGELAESVRAKNLTFGLYHSMYEWFHPLYLEDKANGFSTRNFVTTKTMPELHEIVEKYKPAVIFSDGEWEAPPEYWGSQEFLTWLYNDSPVKDTVVVNDRWGNTTRLTHGGYLTGEDRQQPGKQLLGHKWENCLTVDAHSWGYNRLTPIEGYLSASELIQQLTSTVAFGGNLLLNVGPTAEGVILPIFQERLLSIGDFLAINGEAIYKTRPCKAVQNETAIEGAYYTSKPDQDLVYLSIVPSNGYWPRPGSMLYLTGVKSAESVYMLIANGTKGVECMDTGSHVQCVAPSPYDYGIVEKKVHPLGFTLKLKGAKLQEPTKAPVSVPSQLV
jgi:alpha-L-fucosidase